MAIPHSKTAKLKSRPTMDGLVSRGMPGRNRTYDLLVRNQTLYPLSYGHICVRATV